MPRIRRGASSPPSVASRATGSPRQARPVRVDAGVDEGSEISMFYDPMIAKLVTHGPDRPAAIAVMRDALDRYEITRRRPQCWLSSTPCSGRPPLRRGAALDRLHRGGVRRGASTPRGSTDEARAVLVPGGGAGSRAGSRLVRGAFPGSSTAWRRYGTRARGWSISAQSRHEVRIEESADGAHRRPWRAGAVPVAGGVAASTRASSSAP